MEMKIIFVLMILTLDHGWAIAQIGCFKEVVRRMK